jgi:hypothetical protein
MDRRTAINPRQHLFELDGELKKYILSTDLGNELYSNRTMIG